MPTARKKEEAQLTVYFTINYRSLRELVKMI
jgi:hypothetical protein